MDHLMNKTVVIIDSSYFNFYRFYATRNWYNYSPERRTAAKDIGWRNNPVFMTTFEKMWFKTIKDLCKKFAVQQRDLIFARDGTQVWRYDIYPQYKATRHPCVEQLDAPGPVFKYVNENFHSQLDAKVVRVDTAEADDVIATAVSYVLKAKPSAKIVIITGDHDLLQLSKPGTVDIYKLNGLTKITAEKPYIELMKKILAGDPSDNIPSVYKGCGKKTAQRLAEDPVALQSVMDKYSESYNLNRTLIDFNCIPQKVINAIVKELRLVNL